MCGSSETVANGWMPRLSSFWTASRARPALPMMSIMSLTEDFMLVRGRQVLPWESVCNSGPCRSISMTLDRLPIPNRPSRAKTLEGVSLSPVCAYCHGQPRNTSEELGIPGLPACSRSHLCSRISSYRRLGSMQEARILPGGFRSTSRVAHGTSVPAVFRVDGCPWPEWSR